MPNLYATLDDLRAGMPQALGKGDTQLDPTLYRLAEVMSREADNFCKRTFYPRLQTRRFSGSGGGRLRVPDLISITSVEYSEDDGVTYTALTTDDYIATVEDDENSLESYTVLVLNVNGDLVSWPTGQRSIRIVGVWGYAEDRNECWRSTGDTVQNNPLASDGTSLSVSGLAGADLYGLTPRFSPGQLLRIESEYVETSITRDESANTIAILRARNGTTAAAHAQSTAISVWMPPEPIRRAVTIQAVIQMQRGLSGFGDARATPEVGQLFFFKEFDPSARALLMPYRSPRAV